MFHSNTLIFTAITVKHELHALDRMVRVKHADEGWLDMYCTIQERRGARALRNINTLKLVMGKKHTQVYA